MTKTADSFLRFDATAVSPLLAARVAALPSHRRADFDAWHADTGAGDCLAAGDKKSYARLVEGAVDRLTRPTRRQIADAAIAQLAELQQRREEWFNPALGEHEQGPEYEALLRDIAEADRCAAELDAEAAFEEQRELKL